MNTDLTTKLHLRALALGLISTSLALIASPSVMAAKTTRLARTIYVGENTLGPRTGEDESHPLLEFRDAMTAAASGDTIVILGAYNRLSQTRITKSNLTIKGQPWQWPGGPTEPSDVKCSNGTGGPAEYCFKINDTWGYPSLIEGITIQDLTLTGGTRAPIVVGRNVKRLTIEHNTLMHAEGVVSSDASGFGIYLFAARELNRDVTAVDVHIRQNQFRPTMNTAIWTNNVDGLEIAHNTVPGVVQGDGIVANVVNDVRIEWNSVSGLQMREGDRCKPKVATGIKVRKSNRVTLHKNLVYNTTGAGIMVRVDDSTNVDTDVSTDVNVTENTVFNAVNYNDPAVRPIDCPTDGGWPSAVTLSRITRGTVFANKVSQNWGEGIALNTARSMDVQRNDLHDNFSVNLYLNNASDINVRRNYLGHFELPAHYRNGLPVKGLSLSNERISGEPENYIPLRNIVIANNLIRGGEYALNHYTRSGSSNYHYSGMQNVRIFNNTFHGSYKRAMMAIASGPAKWDAHSVPHQDIHVNANIFYQPRAAALRDIPPDVEKQVQFQSNIWYATPNTCLPGQCVGRPALDPSNDWRVDPALNPDGWTLSASSPAIDSAAYSFPESEAAGQDYFGTVRPRIRKDVGGHEYVSGSR